MYDSRKPLWVNISLLMQERYGGENLSRLAREAVVSPATASRLKAQQTSVGLETIDRLAEYFNVKPHQLIEPNFDPAATPGATLSPLAADLAQALDNIKDPIQHQRLYALALQIIEIGLSVPRGSWSAPQPAAAPAPETSALPSAAPHQHS